MSRTTRTWDRRAGAPERRADVMERPRRGLRRLGPHGRLALDGRQVGSLLGGAAGSDVGEALRWLEEQVAENPELNTPAALSALLRFRGVESAGLTRPALTRTWPGVALAEGPDAADGVEPLAGPLDEPAPAADEPRETIVCGVDGSPEARAAMHVAARLGRRLAARVVLVHADGSAMMADAAHADLARWTEDVPEEVERMIVIDQPAAGLVSAAGQLDATLIVIGSRARRRSLAALRGSVAADVVAQAACPVVVVPRGAHGRPGGDEHADGYIPTGT